MYTFVVEMSSLYEKLYIAYKKRHESHISKQNIRQNCNKFWAEPKQEYKDKPLDLQNATKAKISQLNVEATRQSASFLNYFAKVIMIIFLINMCAC